MLMHSLEPDANEYGGRLSTGNASHLEIVRNCHGRRDFFTSFRNKIHAIFDY